MFFDQLSIDKILKGEKCVTRRIAREHGRRPAVPGSIHKLKKDRTQKTYGKIFINSCHQTTLGALTKEDVKREGFETSGEYFEYFKSLYPKEHLTSFTPVWRVRFTLIE